MKKQTPIICSPKADDPYAWYNPRNILSYLIINAIIALIISFSFCTNCLQSSEGIESFFLDYFFYSFLLSSTLSFGVNQLIMYSNVRFPWLEKPGKRLLFDLIAVSLFSFITGAIYSFLFGFFIWQILDLSRPQEAWDSIMANSLFPMAISLGITIFFTSRSFFIEWRQAAVEAEQMRSERLAGQYQSLKDQLNPHFLFNSLNVLSNLVHENTEQANSFIEKLAKVYRYVLDVQNDELVSINRELEFARSFLELQQIRFGEKLEFSLPKIHEVAGEIPPLSLQLLLENAVKHNSGTREKPLRIEVVISGDELVVQNTLNTIHEKETSSGIGLNNIRERYRFLTDRKVEVIQTMAIFEVKLPILEIRNQ